MSDSYFKGRIKAIQWNNQLFSSLLMLHFFLSIMIFVFLFILPLIALVCAIDPNMLKDIWHNERLAYKFGYLCLKVLMFSFLGALYFIYKNIKDIPTTFNASKLNLAHDNNLYQQLENQCISRGLTMPDLYVMHNQAKSLVTAVVLQNFSRKSFIIFSEGALTLPVDLRNALLAQAVQRIYTKDTLFLTFLCFFGHFPFHILQAVGKVRYTILRPALYVTDLIMNPVRNFIVNLRFARLDAGSLELTKDKGPTEELLKRLSTPDEIKLYYYEAYLPLFIAQSSAQYRQKSLRNA